MKKNQKTRHHRRPKENFGSDDESNISYVTEKRHRAYHILFGSGANVHAIAKQLNEVWIDPAFRLVVIPVINEYNPNQLEFDYPENQEQ